MLETSPSIRIPRTDEIPNNSGVSERLKERENANIVEGFVLNKNKQGSLKKHGFFKTTCSEAYFDINNFLNFKV